MKPTQHMQFLLFIFGHIESGAASIISQDALLHFPKKENAKKVFASTYQAFLARLKCISGRKSWLVFLIGGLLCLSLQFISIAGHAQTGKTFVVNTLGDAEDFNEFDGVCDSDPNTPGEQCTFRAAIQSHDANRQLDHNRISFAIPNAPGTGSIVIKVGSTGLGALPPIRGSVSISGSNSPFPNDPLRRIELDGSEAGPGAIGMLLLGEKCTISFFVINSFGSHGMHLTGTQFSNGGHVISAMFIGTDGTGSVDKGNGGDGIFIEDVPNNMIGGLSIVEGNIIAGNAGYGINVLGRDPDITGFSLGGAPGNKLFLNYIGIDRSETTVMPNDKGGVLIDNARQVQVGELPQELAPGRIAQQQGRGNTIAGEKNGITVTGSLSKGVKIEGNAIGKDGTTAKFMAGILARPGELFSATGNIITNIDSVGINLFFDANGNYTIKRNEVDGKVKTGALIKFAENRTINVEYRNNVHFQNGTGLQIDESLHGTINWVLDSNRATEGTTGAKITFRCSGDKNFSNNTWNFNTGAGIEYFNQFSSDTKAKITINNEFAIGNSGDGFFGRFELEAQADVTMSMLKIFGSRNGKDGLSFGLAAGLGAKAVFNIGGESEFVANGFLAARLIGEKSSIDVFRVELNKSTAKDNVEGAFYLFDVKLKFSVTENTIVNNGPGIRLGGSTEARIDGNMISGNSVGIIAEDASTGVITNNVITGNGKAVVLSGTGVGTPLSSNSIFANSLIGIDLGNDGVTLNDVTDEDVGANNLQNFPVLTSISSDGANTIINGSLQSTPNTNFRIEFFSNTICNASGFGEGEKFLGFHSVTTDATGNAFFTAQFSDALLSGAFITATATDPANNTSEFSGCLSFGTAQTADLELIKSADKTSITIGEQVSFIVKLTNKGPDQAANITVKDLAPAGLTFDEVVTSAGTYDATSGIWSINTLGVNNDATLSIVATATETGTIINTAEVLTSSLPDADSSPGNGIPSEDDQSSVSVTVEEIEEADLELIKTTDKTTYFVGDPIKFVIKLTNKGPQSATNITVKDVIPAGVAAIQASTDFGNYDLNSGLWNIALLNSNAVATLEITATATAAGNIVNTAELLQSDQPDPDSSPGNGVATEDDQSTVSLLVNDVATTPSQLIEKLIRQVNNFVATGALSTKQAEKLNKHLENALKQVNKGHPVAAIAKLTEFIKEVKKLVDKKEISKETGKALITEATKLIVQLAQNIFAAILKGSVNNHKANYRTEADQLNLRTYPNPFNSSTIISFRLEKQSPVQILLYGQNGKLISPILNKVLPAGVHNITWAPDNLPSGIYFVHLRAGNLFRATPIVYMK